MSEFFDTIQCLHLINTIMFNVSETDTLNTTCINSQFINHYLW